MQQKEKKPFRISRPMNAPNTDDMVFGLRPIQEALKAGKEIDKLLVEKASKGPVLEEIISIARERGVNIQYVPAEKLERITKKNHQGLIAYISLVHYAEIENVVQAAFDRGEDPFILVLDSITDVRNFGAISRSAECAGVHAILVPVKGSAQVNSDAMKTSAGALSHIPICKTENLYKAVRTLKDSGLTVVACTEKGEVSLHKSKLTGPVCLVMGSEESGISADVLKLADQQVFIPLMGKIGSLNVSVATGVFLFESLRQKEVLNKS